MIFVSTEDLKTGMRLAKPIYNKNGVLLYDRNTKLTMQGIVSVKNFGLIGLYILEPAEPLPPMTKDDIEFERFQTMAVFAVRDELSALANGQKLKGIMKLANMVVKNYGNLNHKITFAQNLRSTEDFVFKHAINVAILSAMISHQLDLSISEQLDVVIASLLYDVGRLTLPVEMQDHVTWMDEQEKGIIRKAQNDGYEMINNDLSLSSGVKRIVSQSFRTYDFQGLDKERKVSVEAKILQVAHYFDMKTAMKLNAEPESELSVIREIFEDENRFEHQIVRALLQSIRILSPGVCVQMTSGEKGLVIRENEKDPMRPMVLGFDSNHIYNLEMDSVYEKTQIADLMKTMDNRIIVGNDILQEYLEKTKS